MTFLKHDSLPQMLLLSIVLTLLYFKGCLTDKGLFVVDFAFVCLSKLHIFSFYLFCSHTVLSHSNHSLPSLRSSQFQLQFPSPMHFKITMCHPFLWKFKKIGYRILGKIIYMHKILDCFQRCILLLIPLLRIALQLLSKMYVIAFFSEQECHSHLSHMTIHRDWSMVTKDKICFY